MKSVELRAVGLQHRVTPATRREIAKALDGGPLAVRLEREPENVHDANAIKVVIFDPPYKGLHIGYIPRGPAEIWARSIDQGLISKLDAWIVELPFDSDGSPGHEANLLLRFSLKAEGRKKTQGKQKKRSKT